MPIPKDVRFVTFDCYGTLIDWELGAFDAYQTEAQREGFTIDRNTVIPLFLQTLLNYPAMQSGSSSRETS